MKDLEDTDPEEDLSPDKQIEMQDRRYARANDQSDSHRFNMMDEADISERYGSTHMNERAMEYFKNANLAGKTPEQIVKEFQAIQRYKEEELMA